MDAVKQICKAKFDNRLKHLPMFVQRLACVRFDVLIHCFMIIRYNMEGCEYRYG